jgi:predicted regulator of Ras-like GTPase activity (Roadblock/LC7/MglB family)
MAGIEETLRTLRDVQGVYGSFVIAGNGGLVARDLPAVFDGELFAQVGPRAARLYETLVSAGEDLDTCVLRYMEHKLFLRRMTWGLIGIISGVAVNMPALRMVVNLVVRRIDPEVVPSTRLALSAPPPLVVGPLAKEVVEPHPASVAPASRTAEAPDALPIVAQDGRDSMTPASDRHVRMYRGRRVVEG